MLRGFRHTLFLLLQIGVVVSGTIAVALEPQSWKAVLICVVGGLVASFICERIARRYLRYTFGRLRRAALDISRGWPSLPLRAEAGDDFYKLVQAVNEVAARLAKASKEEKRLHLELRERERLAFLGELAASVAHEVNNPLDGVQSCVRILRRSLADPQRSAQMLDLIDSGLERMNLIVRRLLTLAREHVIRPQPASVRSILASALSAVGSRIDESRIQLREEFTVAEDEVPVDPQLIEQVFVNLILNALDSMEAGGVLTLRTRIEASESDPPGGETLCVDVEDTGAGIDPEVLPRIFEPFFTTKPGGKGTGLGLPIAARIVDAHQGAIRVARRAAGGTVFTVRLRRTRIPPAAGAPAPPSVALAGEPR